MISSELPFYYAAMPSGSRQDFHYAKKLLREHDFARALDLLAHNPELVKFLQSANSKATSFKNQIWHAIISGLDLNGVRPDLPLFLLQRNLLPDPRDLRSACDFVNQFPAFSSTTISLPFAALLRRNPPITDLLLSNSKSLRTEFIRDIKTNERAIPTLNYHYLEFLSAYLVEANYDFSLADPAGDTFLHTLFRCDTPALPASIQDYIANHYFLINSWHNRVGESCFTRLRQDPSRYAINLDESHPYDLVSGRIYLARLDRIELDQVLPVTAKQSSFAKL